VLSLLRWSRISYHSLDAAWEDCSRVDILAGYLSSELASN